MPAPDAQALFEALREALGANEMAVLYKPREPRGFDLMLMHNLSGEDEAEEFLLTFAETPDEDRSEELNIGEPPKPA